MPIQSIVLPQNCPSLPFSAYQSHPNTNSTQVNPSSRQLIPGRYRIVLIQDITIQQWLSPFPNDSLPPIIATPHNSTTSIQYHPILQSLDSTHSHKSATKHLSTQSILSIHIQHMPTTSTPFKSLHFTSIPLYQGILNACITNTQNNLMEWKVHPSLLTLQTSSVKPSPSPHLNTHTSYPTSEPFHPKEGTVRHQSQPLKPLTNSSSSTFSHRSAAIQLSIPKEWGHHAISITQHSTKTGKRHSFSNWYSFSTVFL